MTQHCLVLDAPTELSAALAGVPGLVLGPDAGADCEAVIRLYPPALSPFHRQKLLSEVRLDALSRAPGRYNAVIVGDLAPTVGLVRYLSQASAVTGQVLAASTAPSPRGRNA